MKVTGIEKITPVFLDGIHRERPQEIVSLLKKCAAVVQKTENLESIAGDEAVRLYDEFGKIIELPNRASNLNLIG